MSNKINRAHKKSRKEQKRKAIRESKKRAMSAKMLPLIRRNSVIRIKNKADRKAYSQKLLETRTAMMAKLKSALGIPDHEVHSMEKLVKAVNLSVQMDAKKRDAEEKRKVRQSTPSPEQSTQ